MAPQRGVWAYFWELLYFSQNKPTSHTISLACTIFCNASFVILLLVYKQQMVPAFILFTRHTMHMHTPSYLGADFPSVWCVWATLWFLCYIAMTSNTSLFSSFFPAPVVVDGYLTKPKKISKRNGRKQTKKKKPQPMDLDEKHTHWPTKCTVTI